MSMDVIDELQLSSLQTSQELLMRKKETIHQLDTQILAGTADPEGLEELILEIEETQDKILEKVNQIDTFISLRTRVRARTSIVIPPSSATPPVSTPLSSTDTESTAAELHSRVVTSTASATADIESSTTVTAHTATPIASPHLYSTSRLPKLELPTFSGDPLSWQSFWDSFDAAVNNNPTLSPIHKFNYLKAQLQGDAARAIAGLPLTEVNYSQSVTLLKQRFGQPEKLISAHTRALIELPGPTNELSSLQLFHDTTENHIRGLASLGVSKESYSTILVPIILGKLPVPIRRNLARDHNELRWTLDDLQAAVVKEIRILESGLYNNDSSSSLSTRTHATASFHAAIKGERHQNSTGKKKIYCVYCKGKHPPTTCPEVTDYQKRLEIVRKSNLCFNCLGNHKISQCNSKFRCKHCRHRHHTSLCKSTESDTLTSSKPEPSTIVKSSSQQPTQVSTNTAPVIHGAQNTKEATCTTVTLLKTAIAPVIGEGIRVQGNILFDEGSQRSFITVETAAKLKLNLVNNEKVAIAPFGAEYSSPQPIPVVTIKVETTAGEKIPISVLVVPFIAAPLKNSLQTSIESFPHLRNLKLAHPITNEHNFQISILIGADYYWCFVEDKIVRGDGPTAQQSKLGFLLSGPVSSQASQQNVTTMPIATSEGPNLEKFWSIEEAGTSPSKPEQSNTDFIHQYQTTCISQATDGTYTAQFPWKTVHPPLPSNFITCEKRTRQLISHLTDSPSLLNLYHNIITDQEARGFIERVKSTDTQSNVHYLPHHPVKKESATTPIRIVYDCSSRQSKEHASLNDCLQVGPP